MKTHLSILILFALALILAGCEVNGRQQQVSDSGVSKASVTVKTNAQGETVEQTNYIKRVQRDNDVGAIKHLYIVSAYTGDILEYSTVVGKVTSGGKRLSPTTVVAYDGNTSTAWNTVNIGGRTFSTNEVMDENGTYGQSANYIYWFDAQDQYHQYFPSGGTYLRISERPLTPKKLNMTFEITTPETSGTETKNQTKTPAK